MRTHTDDTGSATLTLRLSPKLKTRLGELAERTRRTKSFLAGEAIAGYVERELEIIAGIERGLAAMKAGQVVAHEDVMADTNARIKRARAKAGRRKR
jgi:predicted transcriptional regulator